MYLYYSSSSVILLRLNWLSSEPKKIEIKKTPLLRKAFGALGYFKTHIIFSVVLRYRKTLVLNAVFPVRCGTRVQQKPVEDKTNSIAAKSS